jgi:microcystin-dependent protein
MADTFTTDGVGAILMGIGGDNNTWGTNLNNSAIQVFADALCNALTSTVTGGTLDLSGSPPPAAPSQARHNELAFTGTLTGNQIVVVPNLPKKWWVTNGTSGAFTLTMQLPGAVSPIVIPQTGQKYMVMADGANNLLLTALGLANLIALDGTTAHAAYSFQREINSGWYRAATQDVRLCINGADVLQITGTGAASPSVVNVLSPNSLQLAGTSAGLFTTGDVKLTFKTAADAGWVMMDDSTIGDASSNATHANANTSALWQLLYANISDADAPILTSGGAATTRGAQGSAATAYANHCRLTLPLVLGRALAAAGSGAGLTPRTLGHALGEETHTLTQNELPNVAPATTLTYDAAGVNQTNAITPVGGITLNLSGGSNTLTGLSNNGGGLGLGSGGSFNTAVVNNTGASFSGTTKTLTASTASINGGVSEQPHNTMQPSVFLNVMIKL